MAYDCNQICCRNVLIVYGGGGRLLHRSVTTNERCENSSFFRTKYVQELDRSPRVIHFTLKLKENGA